LRKCRFIFGHERGPEAFALERAEETEELWRMDEQSTGSGEATPAMSDGVHAEFARAREALSAADRRHAAGREREAMLRGELQHRVRNALALVRSIFARTVATGGDLEDLANHFQGRLDVIARYQLSRTHEPGGTVDLDAMVRDELLSFHSSADPRVLVTGPEVRLGHETAQVMGLALHELATNSIKFGVLGSSDTRGQLRIAWRAAGGRLHFQWEESGVAVLGAAPFHSGFGREFIEQALPYQLGAESSFVLRPGGLDCTIELPLPAQETGTE
jgi:two-component sensor histidine kinase